jgi:hypothetical protein
MRTGAGRDLTTYAYDLESRFMDPFQHSVGVPFPHASEIHPRLGE